MAFNEDLGTYLDQLLCEVYFILSILDADLCSEKLFSRTLLNFIIQNVMVSIHD